MTPTDALYSEINSLITSRDIAQGYWRLRTDDWDLPGVVARHLAALGWREPLPAVTDPTPEQTLRLVAAVDLSTLLAEMDRDELESHAFDAIWATRQQEET